MDNITLSNEQNAVLRRMRDWLADPFSKDRVFVLHGWAGTGKTVLLATLASEYPRTHHLRTPTGKAAAVLHARTGLPASTIHALIYRFEDKKRDELGEEELVFSLRAVPGSLTGHTLLVDECGMVGADVGRDILRAGARVIACGDPGQLPPVKGNPFFLRPNAVLNEIHRQAWDSPIIRQAHNVRIHGFYQPDGDFFRVIDGVIDSDLHAADVILTWRRSTRTVLNNYKRSRLGLAHTGPTAGEPVVCLQNDPELGLYNGEVYRLAADYVDRSRTSIEVYRETAPRRRIVADNCFFVDVDGTEDAAKAWVDGIWEARKRPREREDEDNPLSFMFGYAMTVHKSQGSEWDTLIIQDDFTRSDDRRKWLYTGITRAKRRVAMLRM